MRTFEADDLLQHRRWVARLAHQLAGPDGDDAAQDALLASLRSPPRDPSALRGFLAATLRAAVAMAARTACRRRRREAAVAGTRAGLAPSTSDLAMRAELHRELVRCVLDLPEPQRTLVLHHYFDDASMAELAARFALTVDAVRSHLRRARLRLREQLEARHGGDRAGSLLAAAPTAVLPKACSTAAVLAMTTTAKTKLLAACLPLAALAFCAFGADLFATGEPRPSDPPAAAAEAVGGIHATTDARAEAPVQREAARQDAAPRAKGGAPDPEVATLRGRVVEARGEPVPDVRLRAFAVEAGTPRDPQLAEAWTAADGTYELFAWALTDALLTAVPMRFPDGIPADRRERHAMPRDDLGPGCASCSLRRGEAPTLPDLVLPATADVTGSILWPDGSVPPADNMPSLHLRHEGDATLQGNLAWWRSGDLALNRFGNPDDGGRFRIAGARGRRATLALAPSPMMPLVLESMAHTVVPPCVADFQLRGQVLRVRVLVDGAAADDATLLHGTEQVQGVMGLRRGEATCLVPPDLHYVLRASARDCQTVVQRFAQNAVPSEPVVLELRREPAVPVTVDLTGAGITHAVFTWVPQREGAEQRSQTGVVDEKDRRFHFALAQGRYTLRVRAAELPHGSSAWLVPSTHELTIDAGGSHFALPAELGGRMRIEAFDPRGLRRAGTAKLTDPAGAEQRPHFRLAGDVFHPAGALLPDRSSETWDNLAPGTWQLEVDLGPGGYFRRTVEVRARAWADVRLDAR